MQKKVHILYTIPNFDTAGSGKVVYDLARHINNDQFKISIVCNHSKGAFFKEVESLGFPIYTRPFNIPLRPYLSLFSRARSFKDFLKEKEIDLVHSWHWSSDWTEIISCKMAKVPFIYTKKSMGWGNRHWKIKSYLSNFIITVNHAMHDFLKFKKNKALIPFGVDTDFYNPETIPFNKVSLDQPFTLITVANLVPVKNIELIIKTLKQLQHLNIKLNIVGDQRGDYAEQLEQLTSDLGLSEHVIFLGKQNDVRPFLKQADLFIISSFKEGMPMALVEAMTMAVPVLGADIPGISYILSNFKNHLFSLYDPESLKSKIEAMYHLDLTSRRHIGESLRMYCLENLSMESFIKKHETLYLKVSSK